MSPLQSWVRVSIAAASIITIALLAAACSYPHTTRTGAVHDIRVIEGPDPTDLVVNPNDEVRWINGRTLPITLDLVDFTSGNLSCERGFSNIFGMVKESTTIKPNESVSACFTQPGFARYNLRMMSALPGGKVIVPGVVRIGK